MNPSESVKKRLEEPIELSFNDIFNETFLWFKKCFNSAGVIVLMYAVLVSVVGIAIRHYILQVNVFDTDANYNISEYPIDVVALFVLCMSTLYSLTAPMTASVIDCFRIARENNYVDSMQAFKYYGDDSTFQIILSTFILSLINIGLSTALDYTGNTALGVLITALFAVFTCLQIPLIIYQKLNAIDAISYSFQIVSRQPIVIGLLILVAFLFSLMGLIAFCIGFFFTFSMFFGIQYGIYKHIFEYNEITTED